MLLGHYYFQHLFHIWTFIGLSLLLLPSPSIASTEVNAADPSVASEPVLALSDANMQILTESLPQTEWIILFYADWCGACNAIKPHFHQFAAWTKKHAPAINVAAVNHADNPGLMMRFRITQLPTVYHIRGGEYRDISSERSRLPEYIRKDGWKDIEALSSWKGPFSLLGTALAWIGYLGYLLVTRFNVFQNKIDLSLLILGIVIAVVSSIILLTLYGKFFDSSTQEKQEKQKTQ